MRVRVSSRIPTEIPLELQTRQVGVHHPLCSIEIRCTQLGLNTLIKLYSRLYTGTITFQTLIGVLYRLFWNTLTVPYANIHVIM